MTGPYLLRAKLWWRTRRQGSLLMAPFRVTGRGRDHALSIISIGEGTRIGSGTWFSLVSPDARLSIGRDCTIAFNIGFTVKSAITIGDGSAIGDRSLIADHGHDHMSYLGSALEAGEEPAFGWGVTEAAPVVIGKGVHVGAGAVILPGVEIGDGAVVGANSVVTRDVAPYTVVAGVPAKLIKTFEAPTR
jgi:lipopolysaccharide O-acetyltransferase